jgi:hypothetical protein
MENSKNKKDDVNGEQDVFYDCEDMAANTSVLGDR